MGPKTMGNEKGQNMAWDALEIRPIKMEFLTGGIVLPVLDWKWAHEGILANNSV